MIRSFTCVNIIDNGSIIYELQDYTGKVFKISAQKLKYLLFSNKIQVVNLELVEGNIVSSQSYNIMALGAKVRLFGKPYKAECNAYYYVLENPDITIVYIPDDVSYIVDSNVSDSEISVMEPYFCSIECNVLKVVGGSGLCSSVKLFNGCIAKSLDLTEFDTSNIINMYKMFAKCKSESIIFGDFNTSRVTNMLDMFKMCKASKLDLKSFDTSNVKNMEGLFFMCKSKEINVSSFDTSHAENMSYMFAGCLAKSLDLTSFVINKDTNISSILEQYKGKLKATDDRLLSSYNCEQE